MKRVDRPAVADPRNLSRDEKPQVVRLIASELTQQAGVDLLQDGAPYPIWTPLGALDAAKSLQRLLDEEWEQRSVDFGAA